MFRAFIMIDMRKVTIVVISLVLLVGCNVSVNPQKVETVNDKYEQLLVSMERAFNERDQVKLAILLIDSSLLGVIEIPKYEQFFYQAALLHFNGEYETAIEVLNNFDLMLDIDMGSAICVSNNNIKKNGIIFYNKKVYNEMC
jgi:PBP1b-binding outer membrane lipoprotein LpoB